MNNGLKDIFIGELIRRKVDELHYSHSDFAKAIHCARSSLYNLFNSKDISVEKLLLISEVLHYDFLGEIYLKRFAPVRNRPCIVIPLSDGNLDTAHLPAEIVEWLKAQLSVGKAENRLR